MDEAERKQELTDALMRGHEELYATSASFRGNLDFLASMLPVWITGMAEMARHQMGEEYARYIADMRKWDVSDKGLAELKDALEKESRPQFFFPPTVEPKLDWRTRAERSGAAEAARRRLEELSQEEPLSAEEFDDTMRRYREGWDGDPETKSHYDPPKESDGGVQPG